MSIDTTQANYSALRVLQDVMRSMDATQRRIATGLRTAEAKDNPSYWAVASTLQSERKSLSTVNDVLAVEGATVDVAYQSLLSTHDVLSDLQSSIATLLGGGSDASAVRDQIRDLQNSLRSIAGSATFAGQNWLAVDSLAPTWSYRRSLLEAVVPTAAGGVDVSTIDIDTSKLVLFDVDPSGSTLLKLRAPSNEDGGLASASAANVVSVPPTHGSLTYGVDMGKVYLDDNISFFVSTDGNAAREYQVVAQTRSIYDLANDLNDQMALVGEASVTTDGSSLLFTSATMGAQSSIVLKEVKVYVPSSGSFVNSVYSLSTDGEINDRGTDGTDGTPFRPATLTLRSFEPFDLGKQGVLDVRISVDGGPSQTVTIDAATIGRALGGGRTSVPTADAYRAVLTQVLADAGVQGVRVVLQNGDLSLVRTDDVTGGLSISGVRSSRVISIADYDVLGKTRSELEDFRSAVGVSLNAVEAAAAYLGGVSRRLDRQTSFNRSLMDTIDRGVSSLVDANLEEEVLRLKALQVRQQLSIQGLAISNGMSKNVLRLFQ